MFLLRIIMIATGFMMSMASSIGIDNRADSLKEEGGLCYKCTSNPQPQYGPRPFLPYHKNCAGGGPLPPEMLSGCEDVITPYDGLFGHYQRDLYIDRPGKIGTSGKRVWQNNFIRVWYREKRVHTSRWK
ncbi:uncharacterized protein LOC118434116 [Folsomia candida]|uniref:uncharacterized protein LOC118434116 n=1 Tax=Folsomia candida TaxID=158441 RepID=UPI001604E8C6|nr:uncharacterized protein LOC118434116 [Folsomia candida]